MAVPLAQQQAQHANQIAECRRKLIQAEGELVVAQAGGDRRAMSRARVRRDQLAERLLRFGAGGQAPVGSRGMDDAELAEAERQYRLHPRDLHAAAQYRAALARHVAERRAAVQAQIMGTIPAPSWVPPAAAAAPHAGRTTREEPWSIYSVAPWVLRRNARIYGTGDAAEGAAGNAAGDEDQP